MPRRIIRAIPRPLNWDLVVALGPYVDEWVLELAREYAAENSNKTVLRLEWEETLGKKAGWIKRLRNLGFMVSGTRR